MEHGITEELGYLAEFAATCRTSTLPKRFNGVLWSDDLTRQGLHALGLATPQRRVNPAIAAPAAFILTFGSALPVDAASAYRLRVIDAKSGKALPGARVQTDGQLLGITDNKGNLQVSEVSDHIKVTRDGYQPLDLPASQLLDDNLLILIPTIGAVRQTTPSTAPTLVPVKKTPVPTPTVKATQAPVKTPEPTPTPKATPKTTPAPTKVPVSTPTPQATQPPHVSLPSVPTRTPTPEPVPQATKAPRVSQAPHRATTAPTKESLRQSQSYTVQRGDSLWLIAWKRLGDPERWGEIAEMNPQLENPRLIYPGMRLSLPTGAEAPTRYQIQRGDSLWSIAERTLGNGARWREIYQINRPMIRDPHWILPGQELLIPSR